MTKLGVEPAQDQRIAAHKQIKVLRGTGAPSADPTTLGVPAASHLLHLIQNYIISY